MPLPAALTRASRILGEAILDTALVAPPAAADLARRMDRAVDWARVPMPARALAERLDDALWETLAEAILDAATLARETVIEGLRREAREAGPRA
jgi:hypothetical protein